MHLALIVAASVYFPIGQGQGEAMCWTTVQGNFRIEHPSLTADCRGPAVAVLTGRRVHDFVLEAEVLRPRSGQVGVSFRRQSDTAPWADGYYLNSMWPSHLRLIRKRNGRYDAPLFDSRRVPEMQPGNTVRVRLWARGDHFRVWLNDRLVLNVRDEEPFRRGGVAIHVGSGGSQPPASFANVRILGVNAVPAPTPEEIPPLGLDEVVAASEKALAKAIPAIRRRLADAAKDAMLLDDAPIQRLTQQVHGLLWRHFYDPRTHMVYTIIEPHTGKVVLPSRQEVLASIPNANGWSTPIEDCAGYGNGKHLAWLVERWEVTRKPEHAADARKVLAGALRLGEIRPADKDGFAEVVRGVLPDNTTYYAGKGPGSSGDNYNGYAYGLWRCTRSPLFTPAEKQRIVAALDRTCYRNGSPAFVAIVADATGKDTWQKQYEAKCKATVRSFASWTLADRKSAASWTAVQLQIRLNALRTIDTDPLRRRAFEHAMRVNAWSRWKDIPAAFDYDESVNAYMHRVKHVRNPLDAMLTVMLTGDRNVIEAFLPVIRRALARFDFAAFRDQRQLTPFLGAWWLAVRHGALRYDPALTPPPADKLALKPLAPKRHLIVTYFPTCNPRVVPGERFHFPRADTSP